MILGNNERPLASPKSAAQPEDWKTRLPLCDSRLKSCREPAYVSDFLSMLRSKSITPGVIPLFSSLHRARLQIVCSVTASLLSNRRRGIPGQSGDIQTCCAERPADGPEQSFLGHHGATLAPSPPCQRGLRRPFTGTQVVGGVRPQPGDIIRNTPRGRRVIRNGVDVGPLATRRAVWL